MNRLAQIFSLKRQSSAAHPRTQLDSLSVLAKVTANSTALPRSARLSKKKQFSRVFNSPIVSADAWFRVLARPNHVGLSRLGMAVSRKVDLRATGRNRLKRIVRESFRQYGDHRQTSVDVPTCDYVVLPRREAASICNIRLSRSLEAHWARIRGKARSKKVDSE